MATLLHKFIRWHRRRRYLCIYVCMCVFICTYSCLFQVAVVAAMPCHNSCCGFFSLRYTRVHTNSVYVALSVSIVLIGVVIAMAVAECSKHLPQQSTDNNQTAKRLFFFAVKINDK